MPRFLSVLLALAALAAAQSKKPVTVDAVLAQRPPMGMAGMPNWAPDGRRFVHNEGGKLILFDAATKSKRALVEMSAFTAAAAKAPEPEVFPFVNRGVREKNVQWFPSGRELLISAGGDLFLFRIDAGGWAQLTETPVSEADPKLSPDGRKVSFRRDHDLYVMDLATKKITRLTHDGSATLLNGELDWVYPEELALGTAHWWSPDSKRIAYMQFDVSREPIYPQVDLTGVKAKYEPQRYPQAGDPNADVRVGVVSADGGRTQWLDFGQTRENLLARVYWTPDSQTVAALKLNRIQNRLDLLFGDAKTGASRTVLRESDPYWINVREDLQFINNSEFIWPSERDGFHHLYRYSVEGKELGRLTSGKWEVTEMACVDDRNAQVFYVSTEAHPLERQFYRIGFDGNGKRRISEGAGTHNIQMSPTCEYYLDTYSGETTPPGTTVRSADGKEIAVHRKPDTKAAAEYDILPSEIVEVTAADGKTVLYGRLLRPKGFQEGKRYPVIVNVYGGPHAQSVAKRWSGGLSLDQAWAHKGYVVWALDNRGTFNRGHEFEAAVHRNLGAVELADQKAGVQWLIDKGIADPKRIGITGWSYGGYMTLYSLLNAPDVFAVGVAGAPVTHWRNYDTIYTERYMGLPSENEDGYRKSAPLEAASKLKGKLLLVHNMEDDNVLVQNSVQMAVALQKASKQFEMMFYSPKSHGLDMAGRRHFTRMAVDFFDRALAPGK